MLMSLVPLLLGTVVCVPYQLADSGYNTKAELSDGGSAVAHLTRISIAGETPLPSPLAARYEVAGDSFHLQGDEFLVTAPAAGGVGQMHVEGSLAWAPDDFQVTCRLQ